ncbi:MAG TPA: hypothetical protein VLS86_07735, partial [Acidimicrobiia bacterium]|nr:hypothetical protein [Acidimicrobiia bacterium]
HRFSAMRRHQQDEGSTSSGGDYIIDPSELSGVFNVPVSSTQLISPENTLLLFSERWSGSWVGRRI